MEKKGNILFHRGESTVSQWLSHQSCLNHLRSRRLEDLKPQTWLRRGLLREGKTEILSFILDIGHNTFLFPDAVNAISAHLRNTICIFSKLILCS